MNIESTDTVINAVSKITVGDVAYLIGLWGVASIIGLVIGFIVIRRFTKI